MILVDSSCWIEFYRPGGDAAVQTAVLDALATGRVAVCSLIEVEIMANIKRKKEYELVSEDFSALHWLHTGRKEVNAAVEMGRTLRGRGVTVPATDLLIAGIAVANSATVLHADKHFVSIAEHYPGFEQRAVI